MQSPWARLAALISLVLALCASSFSFAAATPLRIVVLGDSLSAGYGLRQGAAFPEVLQRRLQADHRDMAIVNAGVSGDTAADGLARLDWSVPDETDLVIVELGANDMLRGHDPDVTRRTLETLLQRLRDRGMALVIAGTRSLGNYGPDYQARFEAIYPALAKRFDAPLFPHFMDAPFSRPNLLLPDGLHPNAAGVEAIVESFLPFIKPIVDRTPRVARKNG